MKNVCTCILAAGDGKRMKSAHPKVLCKVLFKPMIAWVIDCCQRAGISSGCAVLGSGAEEILPLLPAGFQPVMQTERLGTGHAASMASDYLQSGGFRDVVVLNGDAPFISPEDLQKTYQLHQTQGNAVTLISAQVEQPAGYGRVLRDDLRVLSIVEEKDATPEQRTIREINAGAYWFNVSFLLDYFAHMTSDNAQGEYYLTDCITYAHAKQYAVGAYTASGASALGANSRADLALLNQMARDNVLAHHRANGVDIPFTDGVVIGADVQIAPDTTILPGTVLRGNTVIGAGCEIGPNSYLIDAQIGDDCMIISSQIERSCIKNHVHIGPMSNIRPNCQIDDGVKIGDFVEIKNSVIGQTTSVSHLTYVGDSDVGARCNFGCGVVTVNYDGSKKYRTTIGDEAFIGCNTNLVAPVTVGNRVYSAAGTTITDDVPDGALVIGRAHQVIKENWASEKGRYNKYQP